MPLSKKVEPISDAEKSEAVDELRELSGFAADNTEQRLFLKCAFHTGDISTVWINPILAGDLFWYLKRLLRDHPESAGSPLRLRTDMEPAFGGFVADPPDWC
jgi:hypothetical protein